MLSSKTPSEKGHSLKPDDVLDNSRPKSDDNEDTNDKPKRADADSDIAENGDTSAKEDDKTKDKDDTLDESKKESPSKDDAKDASKKSNESESEKCTPVVNGSVSSDVDKPQFFAFPGQSDLNGRLRRLISSFQREKQKEMARQAAIDKRNERRERIEQVIREREQQKIEMLQRRWSRREEIEFFRTLVAYGVNFDTKANKYDWERFKQLSKLDKKYDETLAEYYLAFLDMCERVSGKKSKDKKQGKYLLKFITICNYAASKKT